MRSRDPAIASGLAELHMQTTSPGCDPPRALSKGGMKGGGKGLAGK